MGFPQENYRLNPSDAGGLTVESVANGVVETATSATIDLSFRDVPRDKIFVLTNISGFMDPGATQAANRVVVGGFTAAGQNVNVFREDFAGTADKNETFNWQGEVMFRGRGNGFPVIEANTIFSAGVASNTFRLAMCGYVIPRGNIAEW